MKPGLGIRIVGIRIKIYNQDREVPVIGEKKTVYAEVN
jgi:hypothetical protein